MNSPTYRKLTRPARLRRPKQGSEGPLGLWANTGGESGLDIHARSFRDALRQEGVPVEHAGDSSCRSRSRGRYSHGLAMGLPLFWHPRQMNARERIAYLVYEATPLPEMYVKKLKGFDRVWTASQFGKRLVGRSSLRVPVDVVPGGVDCSVFHPAEERSVDGTWVLTTIGKPEARKNYEALIESYRKAFTAADDVVLRVLATGLDAGRAKLRRIIRESDGPQAARIDLLAPLPDAGDVAGLLRESDVFVLPTHGEGWGLPILEAMASGCCVITTNWSAPTDFTSAGNALLLDHQLVPAQCPHFGSLFRGTRWAEPSREQLVEHMRWTYLNRSDARELGRRAAEDAAGRWTWRHAARVARRALGMPQSSLPHSRVVDG